MASDKEDATVDFAAIKKELKKIDGVASALYHIESDKLAKQLNHSTAAIKVALERITAALASSPKRFIPEEADASD